MRRFIFLTLTMILVGTALGAAADLTGTVTNGTTNKPSIGNDVVLVTLSQDGMSEGARTTSDRSGHFRLPLPDTRAAYLVRVIHQGVMYHAMAEPGVKALAVNVYDTANVLSRVSAVMDVMRFEATNETLEIKQLVTVRNESRPPRTLMNDRPFEIQLPPGARLQSGLVQFEDGQPLKRNPVPGERKGQYHFVFPVRPGDTRFAVVYRLPYDGTAQIEPTIRNPGERFVVMLPKSMKFEPKAAGIFQPMPDTTPDHVEGTGPMTLGQMPGFRISGSGTLQELQGRRKQTESQQTQPTARPGGGLGPPVEAPDPLQKYRWQILAGLTGLIVSGALYVAKRTRPLDMRRNPPIAWRTPTRSINQEILGRRNKRRQRQIRGAHKSSH